MEQIYLIITISAIIMFSPMIANLIKTPAVVVEIFLGMFAGYFGLVFHFEILKLLAELGLLYLMFLAGLEVNLKLANIVKKDLAINVSLYFAFLYGLSAIICFTFNLSILYLLAFPIFSLGMLMVLIKEYGKEEKWLNIALAVGVVGEVLSILGLTIFSGWLEYGFGFDFFLSVLTLFSVLIATLLILKLFRTIFWWHPELKTYIIPDVNRLDQDIRFAFALFFILIALMIYLKIDVVLGAFIAGLFLKIFFHTKEELFEKLSSIGFGFFIPIFFIYTGSTVDVNMITKDIFLNAVYIVIGIVVVRAIASFATFYNYLHWKENVLFALSASIPLTFLVAISMIAFQHKLITQDEYYAFILASMIDGLVLLIVIRKMYGWLGFAKKNNR
ncbi:MAG: cation:proton antiporter [Arcobacteraceae bacterium]|nr:cation:proton antiporter [Arcobacteraceae bacterium]